MKIVDLAKPKNNKKSTTTDENGREIPTREYIVLHPFFKNVSRVLIAGPSGSGKTVLLSNILLQPLLYFEEIIMYTKTPDQPRVQEMQKIFNNVAKKNKIDPFFTLKNGVVDDVEKLNNGKYKIVIFDDYICEKKEMNTITKYFILGRHYLVSPIFLSQSYYSTPKNIRINCSHFCIFNVGTKREVNSILADHSNISERQYRDNTEGHDFISINKIDKWVGRNLDEALI
jgi:hypothetical protein